jgi:hypothetical protein
LFSEGIAYQCLLKNELLGAGIEDLKVIITVRCFSVKLRIIQNDNIYWGTSSK